ncbi:MAG TPA: MFS transporter [Candidatus Stackebrandtia faecavium]|nr:MFS transporter [Candidatus Stackebrandtia faecavium]
MIDFAGAAVESRDWMTMSPRWLVVRLRISGAMSALGNGMTGVAVTVYLATVLPAQWVGVALTALSLGMLFSFAHGGHYADTHGRVRIMIVADLVRAAATLTVVAAALAPTVATAVLLAVVGCLANGLAVGYYRPSLAAYWSSVVPADALADTLAENSIINRIGLAAGAGLGGAFIAMSQPAIVLAIDAGTFVVSAVIVIGLRDARELPARTDRSAGAQIVNLVRLDRQWAGLFTVAARVGWMPRLLAVGIAMSVVTALHNVVMPIVLTQRYTPAAVGVFLTLPVWALLAGSVASRFWRRAKYIGVLDWWGKTGSSVSGLFLAAGVPIGVSVACNTSGSLAQATADPKISAFVGRAYPESERGQIFAAQMGASSSLGAVGMLLASLLMTVATPTHALVIASAAGIGITAVLLVSKAYLRLALDGRSTAVTEAGVST